MKNYLEKDLALAKKLGTSTLYESSNIKNTALDSEIKAVWLGAILAGPAYPIACTPGDNLAIQIGLEKAPRGSIIVVTTDNFVAGYWGEVLTVAAESIGIKGLVIDGGVRDVAAIRERQFPVFSRGVSVCGTQKASFNSVGKAMQITGTPVQTGDLVVADDDGVIILPQQNALQILKEGKAREEKEAIIMQQLQDGKTTLELMGLLQWREK